MTILAVLLLVILFLPWQRRILSKLFGHCHPSRQTVENLAAAVLEGAQPDPQLPAQLVKALHKRRQTHQDACAQAEHFSRTDPVTGLFKRWYLEYRAVGKGFIILCDLIDLKTINDREGLTAGDALLAQVAKTLQTSIRTADLAARLDGGLIAVWCPDIDQTGAEVVQKRLSERITRQTMIQTRILPVPASFVESWWK
jgi:diguanylate cyclase (GGDEF)-like protein